MTKNLENFLCKFHNKKYTSIVGNGTTALYLGIKCSGTNIRRVGIPNNSCIHLPIAIKLANCIPVFLDIEKKGYSVDLNSLKNSKIDCFIHVHAYGKNSKIEKVKRICEKKKIFLIEDVAVAQGGYYKNKPLGSFGKISILSFGKGKVIDAGIGGAVLTNDLKIYNQIKKHEVKLPLVKKKNILNVNYLNNLHTKFYNMYFLNNKKVDFKKFKHSVNKKSKYFLFKISDIQKNYILKECYKLKFYTSNRIKNFIKLRNKIKKLNKGYIHVPNINKGEIPWRLNVFFSNLKKRNELLRLLLNKKLNVSSWYSGLDLFFKKKIGLKNSELHSKSILNLWIDEKCDRRYQHNVVKYIKRL